MTSLRIIGILLVINGVFAKNLKFKGFAEDSEENDDDNDWLFHDAKSERAVQDEFHVCQTDACKIISSEFLKSMNTSVDPCDNFYDYVCGGWNGRIDIIPSYEGSWGRSELFQFTVNKRIKGILEGEPQPSDILPVRQAKKMYASCMDLQAREERGLIPLESILMRTGGWPMIMDREEWYDEDASWQEIEKNYFYINGKFVFYDIDAPYLRKLYGEEFIERIDLAPGSLPFAKEFPHKWYLGRDEMMEEYAKVIEKVAIEFIKHNKAAVTEEMLRKDIDDLLEFDRQIQKLLRSDHDDAEISVGEFLELYNGNVTDIPDEDKIDFGNHMKILFGMENIKINRTVQMLIQSPTYYSNITLLLKETPIRTIANYIHWNFVSNMLPHATKKLQDIYDNVVAKKPGAVKRKPSWMECVQMIKMDQASSYAFVMKYFSDETEKAAVEMTENVRNEMEWQIDNSDWLDDLGKKFTKDKLRSMKFFIGFPSWYKNRTAVMNSYKGLKIGYDYFENILNFEKYSVREHLRYLKNVKQDEHWGMEPVMVNALYAGPQNYLNIPAADLQPPFFTPDFPDNVNYGSIGSIIGHEIGHAFDDSGIRVGEDGEDTKLSKMMIESYYKRAECFLDQFNNYWGVTEIVGAGGTPSYRGRSIGRRTRGENIADTTGLNSVYQAYRKLRETKGKPDERLPDFQKYTDDQMFFISFASAWCQVMRPEYAETLKKRDEHSPNHMRVIGAVSNVDGFAKAFNCPKGSPMNPENKCDIWDAEESSLTNEIDDFPRRRHRSRWSLSGW